MNDPRFAPASRSPIRLSRSGASSTAPFWPALGAVLGGHAAAAVGAVATTTYLDESLRGGGFTSVILSATLFGAFVLTAHAVFTACSTWTVARAVVGGAAVAGTLLAVTLFLLGTLLMRSGSPSVEMLVALSAFVAVPTLEARLIVAHGRPRRPRDPSGGATGPGCA